MAVTPHIEVGFAERGELSKIELQALADYTANQLLGVSAEEGFALLDSGELEGKASEWPLLAVQRLLKAS
jgi:hypothetical protein